MIINKKSKMFTIKYLKKANKTIYIIFYYPNYDINKLIKYLSFTSNKLF